MAEKKFRTLNRDGTSNIDRSAYRRGHGDLYHTTLAMPWSRFFLWAIGVYIGLNFIFALLYFWIGPGGLAGAPQDIPGIDFFTICYFFSVQTFSTIGYGTLAPQGLASNILVSAEAFTGMLSIALMSGILFARFSKPTAKVKFSDHALITTHMGKQVLMFRMANARLNRIAEADVSVVLFRTVKTPEGNEMRMQFDLPLARSHSQVFAASWLVTHVIDETSPLFGLDQSALERIHAEILVSVMGFDEIFSQTILARYSYLYDEVLWNRNFADMISRNGTKLVVNIEQISQLKPE